jgi:hypothetical protein
LICALSIDLALHYRKSCKSGSQDTPATGDHLEGGFLIVHIASTLDHHRGVLQDAHVLDTFQQAFRGTHELVGSRDNEPFCRHEHGFVLRERFKAKPSQEDSIGGVDFTNVFVLFCQDRWDSRDHRYCSPFQKSSMHQELLK